MKTRPATHCYLCGKGFSPDDKITKDHVPPKGLFLPPLPANFITVPCCEVCNNSNSEDEELFRLALTLGINQSPEALRVYEHKTLPNTINEGRLKKRLRPILDKARHVWVQNRSILQPASLLPVPESPLKAVCEKIARGLTAHLFHHLPVHEIPFEVHLPKNVDLIYEIMATCGPGLKELQIGDVFHSHYGVTSESASEGLWVMTFYRTFYAVVFFGKTTLRPRGMRKASRFKR